jgi:hypothetical protein
MVDDSPIGRVGSVESITLERMACQVQLQVSREELAHLGPELTCREVGDNLIYQLRAYVLAREVRRQVVAKRDVPLSWVDGLKLAAADWIERRLPFFRGTAVRLRLAARTERIETEVREYRTCPHLNSARPGDDHLHLRWLSGR